MNPKNLYRLVAILLFVQVLGESFNYKNHGLDWQNQCYFGNNQSPINIISNLAKRISSNSDDY